MDNRLAIFAVLTVAATASKIFFPRAYVVTKPLPLLFIIVLAFLHPTALDQLWFAAIFFGLMGDMLLLYESKFVLGLLSFLLGHIFYIWAFHRDASGAAISPALLLGVAAVGVGALVYLVRHLVAGRKKKYIIPVILYIAVTCTLVAYALRYPLLSTAALGALLFAFSDFLLAFGRFVRRIVFVEAMVLLTYFSAQWLLARHFAAF